LFFSLFMEIKNSHVRASCSSSLSATSASLPLNYTADRILINEGTNENNDTNRCQLPIKTNSNFQGCSVDTVTPNGNIRNTKDSDTPSTSGLYQTQTNSVEVVIDCEVLLSQMMNEASKVVTMAVELTNLAWKNNTQEQQELNNLYDNNVNNISRNNMNNMNMSNNTANLIVADDDDDCDSVAAVQDSTHAQAQVSNRKRSRCDLCDHPFDNSTVNANVNVNEANGAHSMSKQVSEIFAHPPAVVMMYDEEHQAETQETEPDPSSSNVAKINVVGAIASTSTTTITNLLDMVNRDTNCFVSDPSFESTSSSSEQESEHDHEELEREHQSDSQQNNKDSEDYKQVCDIVDFALAGNVSPACFSSNKRLRTK